jgi:aminomethyltransferase
MSNPLKHTPLHDLHLSMGARIVEFGGWEMPVQYQGIVAEHQAVRSHVGMFDVSHMGKFSLQGEGILESLQKLVPSNLARLKSGQAQYTVLLNQNGGIIDDVIFYFHGGDRWSVIVNAATTDKDKIWLKQHVDGQLIDRSTEKLLIAVQGKSALAALQPFVTFNLQGMSRFSYIETEVLGKMSFVARTGYTGEDGCEVMIDIEPGRELWRKLGNAGVPPCGLGCRDTLRLEAGMHLYGQDMDDMTTPLEADLGWLVHLKEKGDFIGRSHLEVQKATGLSRRLVALEMEGRNIARHDYPIRLDGETIGVVTSGTMSPTLGKAIALGYVPAHLTTVGQALQVQIRDRDCPARIVKRPFYKSI